MNYEQQFIVNSFNSYNIENAKIGTFTTRLISIKKEPEKISTQEIF